MNTIEENVKALLKEISGGNPYGEKVTLVAATKTRTPEEIQRAIDAGITDIGENRVQEFTQKFGLIQGGARHFIGRLQLNKIKYLVGKTHLIHSADRPELLSALAALALKRETVQDVLIEVNIGGELTKGGYARDEALESYRKAVLAEGIRPRGFMAMLPPSDDLSLLKTLAREMRRLFEEARDRYGADILSMGMSGDYRLCVEEGSNMIRLGTAIFGQRE